MIQRIQSVYLFLVAVCAVVCLCMPVGHFHQDGIGVADFYNLWLTMADGARVFAPWAMFVLLVLAAFTSFAAIFLFKRRMFQVRLSVFSSLILVGYYIVFGVFVYVFKSRYDADFTLSGGRIDIRLSGFPEHHEGLIDRPFARPFEIGEKRNRIKRKCVGMD